MLRLAPLPRHHPQTTGAAHCDVPDEHPSRERKHKYGFLAWSTSVTLQLEEFGPQGSKVWQNSLKVRAPGRGRLQPADKEQKQCDIDVCQSGLTRNSNPKFGASTIFAMAGRAAKTRGKRHRDTGMCKNAKCTGHHDIKSRHSTKCNARNYILGTNCHRSLCCDELYGAKSIIWRHI